MSTNKALVSAGVGIFSALLFIRPASVDAASSYRGRTAEIRDDVAELRKDRAEFHNDLRELNKERLELGRDLRRGAPRSEIIRDRGEIRQDLRELSQDRRELWQDRVELHRDLYRYDWHRSPDGRWYRYPPYRFGGWDGRGYWHPYER